MKKLKYLILTIFFSTMLFANPTINYSIHGINSTVEECLVAAKISLSNSGYTSINTTSQHSIAQRGEFLTTIICTKPSVVVFIVNGTTSNPVNERKVITKHFWKNLKK